MKWTEEELIQLNHMYTHGCTLKEMAKTFNRSVWGIKKKARKLNIMSPYKQKIQDGKCFCPNCSSYKDVEEFGSNKGKITPIRTYCKDCEATMKETKEKKVRKDYMKWTYEKVQELAFLCIQGYSYEEIGEYLGATTDSIKNRANKIGLPKVKRKKTYDEQCFCAYCFKLKDEKSFRVLNTSEKKYPLATYCYDCEKEIISKLSFAESRTLNVDLNVQDSNIKTKKEINNGPFRTCTLCEETLPVDEFSWKRTGKQLNTRCPKCRALKTKESELKRIAEKGYGY